MSENKPGPKLDPVRKEYIDDLKMPYCCEDCTHFDDEKIECTFGFPVKPHLRQTQLEQMAKTGEMAICRLMEID